MDREYLATLLERDGEAYAACRSAVLAGATISVSEASELASAMTAKYARLHQGTRLNGIPAPGFAVAVQHLRDLGQEAVRFVAVDVEDPPYHFHLFLDETLTAVLVCVGIDGRTGRPVRPGEQVLLECQIIGVESDDFPGRIRASVVDAMGCTWPIVEKAPVLGVELLPGRPLAKIAYIRTTVVQVLPDDDPSRLPRLVVSTAVDGVSAGDGTDQFTVTRESVRHSA